MFVIAAENLGQIFGGINVITEDAGKCFFIYKIS